MAVVKKRVSLNIETFSLDKFIAFYIMAASPLARHNLDLSEFNRRLTIDVATSLNIEENFVGYMSHPLHWEFFFSKESYFNLIMPKRPGEAMSVGLKRDYDFSDIGDLFSSISEKYRGHFESRITRYTGRHLQEFLDTIL